MRIEEFRDAVKREFGENLEHATPANVREFLDRLSADSFAQDFRGRIEINEPKATYDEIFRDFFVRVLDMEHDKALILLWTMAFELTFAAIEHDVEDRFRVLFGEPE
jgi:hypothetical protein